MVSHLLCLLAQIDLSIFASPFSLLSETTHRPSLTSDIRRQGFGGRSNKSNQNQNPGKGNGQGTPSPTTPNYSSSVSMQAPNVPPVPNSPALSSAMSLESQGAPSDASSGARRPPFFFRDEYSNLIVKGNFMTLAAKPKLVEEGEWLAHQGMLILASRGSICAQTRD
jgi:hypothetical protein